MLGYSDSDNTIERKGYVLLRESDLTIFTSKDVRFDGNAPMIRLTEETECHEDNERDDLEFLETSSFGHDTENFYTASEYDSV